MRGQLIYPIVCTLLFASDAPQLASSLNSGCRLPRMLLGFERPLGTLATARIVSDRTLSAEEDGTS